MASTIILKLIAILSLTSTLLLSLHPQATVSFDLEVDDEEEYYVIDTPLTVPKLRPGSRFLSRSTKKDKIRKGAHCDAQSYYNNICNGISVNNGTGILNCCKKHCRNILRDENNCGECGHKCQYWQRCCSGVCVDILNDAHHCGKCEKSCQEGVKCEWGSCGYA